MHVAASTKACRVTDARSARAQRTRTAIADAMIELVLEGSGFPTAADIARRSKVGVRTVFHHFGDIETLFIEVIRRFEPTVASLIVTVNPHSALDQRVRDLVEQRHRVFCRIAPVRRVARGNNELTRSQAVLAAKRRLQYVLDRQVHETFAHELRLLPDRHGTVLRITSTLSFEMWDYLTRERGLSGAQAQRHLTVLVMRELAG